MSVDVLDGTEDHPHARLVLGAGLASGEPSHAYLFHGPAGTGKRRAARALAAALLAEDAADPAGVRRRVLAGAHPDLTWVVPSGAHVMRVEDIAGPVVSAATRTPFEAKRRVFVLERVETMNDEVANRMLKTLEEPAPFVHLVLLTSALGRVVETVVSRCQLVRFDPLPAERIAATLEAEGVEPQRAVACSRLALGDADRARLLASAEGDGIRRDAERVVLAALDAEPAEPAGEEPWRALLTRAERRRAAVEQELAARSAARLELEPTGRERRAIERSLEESAKREGRRARTEVLELGLELAALSFRDMACAAEGAQAAVLATDRPELLAAGAAQPSRRLREAVERCEEVRESLTLNVGEELALAALGFRLKALLGSPVG
jgi:DNA polymerase-3 subunit delta'